MEKCASVFGSFQIGDQRCQIWIFFTRAFELRDEIEYRIELLRQRRFNVTQVVTLRDRSRKLWKKTDLAKIFVLTTYSSLNSDALLRELLEDAACRVVSVIIHIVVGFLVGVVPQWSASWLVIFWLIFITTFKKLWKNGSEIDDVCNRCCAVYFFFLKWQFLNFSNKKLSIHFFKMALFKPE